MGNALVYGKSGPPSYDDGEGASFDDMSVDTSGRALKGRACPAYKVFLQPFLESQFNKLMNEGVGIIQRKDQPGDEQLRKLCLENDCLPASAQSPNDPQK
jgi:hypothetical protein